MHDKVEMAKIIGLLWEVNKYGDETEVPLRGIRLKMKCWKEGRGLTFLEERRVAIANENGAFAAQRTESDHRDFSRHPSR